MEYLGTLSALEYRGWVVIERETGMDRIADVAAGVAFLRRLVSGERAAGGVSPYARPTNLARNGR